MCTLFRHFGRVARQSGSSAVGPCWPCRAWPVRPNYRSPGERDAAVLSYLRRSEAGHARVDDFPDGCSLPHEAKIRLVTDSAGVHADELLERATRDGGRTVSHLDGASARIRDHGRPRLSFTSAAV